MKARKQVKKSACAGHGAKPKYQRLGCRCAIPKKKPPAPRKSVSVWLYVYLDRFGAYAQAFEPISEARESRGLDMVEQFECGPITRVSVPLPGRGK